MTNEAWIERQTETPEARRRYEQERLILWTTEAIWEAMEDQGLSQAQVAKKLGTSRANVTQLLSGSRNMTLRSLAALAHVCGMRFEPQLEELSEAVYTRIEDQTVPAFGTVLRFSTEPAWPELPLDATVPVAVPEDQGDSEDSQLPTVRLAA